MEVEFDGERKVRINQDQTILEASLRAGIPHFHACGGIAKCSTCRVAIIEGGEFLNSINKREDKLRRRIWLQEDVRLACQTTTSGPVKVRRIIKDEADLQLYFKFDNGSRKRNLNRKPLGEEKHLVLFFLDIRDFTPFVETHLPFDVIDVWRRLFSIFYRVITRNGGQIIETAGDELYAVFGFRSSLKAGSNAAINSGLTILSEVETFNKDYLGLSFSKEFQIGIGVHSGKVLVGELVLGRLKKTSVMGLAVNIASRIQNATKEVNNSFVISEDAIRHSTFQHDKDSIEINLKGIRAPYHVHLLGKAYK